MESDSKEHDDELNMKISSSSLSSLSLISTWSEMLEFTKNEIISLRDLCIQRDDDLLKSACDAALSNTSNFSDHVNDEEQHPIVDIAITNNFRVPKAFESIKKTISGSKADLNEGMNEKPIFLCVRKTSKNNKKEKTSEHDRKEKNAAFLTPIKNIKSSTSVADIDHENMEERITLKRQQDGTFGITFRGTKITKVSMTSHAAGLRVGQDIRRVNNVAVSSEENISFEIKKLNDSEKIQLCVASSSSNRMRPITRLLPVFTDGGGFIPPGWFPVCHFPTGTVADVNAGSRSGYGEVLLCGERGNGSPVTDIQVIFGSSRNLIALRPLPKHRMIWRSLQGCVGDLNHLRSRSRSTVFLALRHDYSWLCSETSRKNICDMRLNLIMPLLMCITENSPKFYQIACGSLKKLIMKGFFDPPGLGFIPKNCYSNSILSSSSSYEIRDQVSTLPAIDFVLGYLCENFPPTIDPSVRFLVHFLFILDISLLFNSSSSYYYSSSSSSADER